MRIEEVVLYDSKWKLWLLLFHCFPIILNNNKKQEMNELISERMNERRTGGRLCIYYHIKPTNKQTNERTSKQANQPNRQQ